MKDDQDLGLAKVLPLHEAQLLRHAAQTPISIYDPTARIRAIDQAIKWIKQQHPQFFR